jgi:sulfide:quinone oxidoreductase
MNPCLGGRKLTGMDAHGADGGRDRLRVIVYGGDLAALETALALKRLCGERCELTLLTPVRDLPIRTHAAGASASEVRPARFDLGTLAAEHGLEFRSDAIVAVDDRAREARTITGARLPFDALVVAFGARPRGAIPGVTTCWGPGDAAALDALLDDLRRGEAESVAFAVPRGLRWTLPTYELALTTARRAAAAGVEGATITLVTYERRVVELLGPDAERAITARLEKAGIALITEREAAAFADGSLVLNPEGSIAVDRAVAMPIVEGPRIGGLPRDAEGFLPVDAFGRVQGAEGIWAAGEVTSFPVRQAGIAAQQALVVAAAIAAEAGVEIESEPFRPVVRGLLRSESGNGAAPTLWWPPEQLAGEHLSASIASKLAVTPPSGYETIPVAVELGPDGRRIAGAAS